MFTLFGLNNREYYIYFIDPTMPVRYSGEIKVSYISY